MHEIFYHLYWAILQLVQLAGEVENRQCGAETLVKYKLCSIIYIINREIQLTKKITSLIKLYWLTIISSK